MLIFLGLVSDFIQYKFNQTNYKQNYELIAPRQTALIDENKKILISSKFAASSNILFWSKLYHGQYLSDLVLDITTTRKAFILNLLKVLPKNLNGYNLTLNINTDNTELNLLEFINRPNYN